MAFIWPKRGWSPQSQRFCNCTAELVCVLYNDFECWLNASVWKKIPLLFRGVKQCWLAVSYRLFVTFFIFMGTWKIGPVGCPETSVHTNSHSITCQNSEDINSQITLFLAKSDIENSLISIPPEHIL
jgi:hypothetical protein